MPGPFRVLPILQNLCATIDELYIEEVGPFGTMVAEEVRAKWLATGNKVRTSDVDQYIGMLAEQLDDPWKRSEFVMRARQLVGIRLGTVALAASRRRSEREKRGTCSRIAR